MARMQGWMQAFMGRIQAHRGEPAGRNAGLHVRDAGSYGREAGKDADLYGKDVRGDTGLYGNDTGKDAGRAAGFRGCWVR